MSMVSFKRGSNLNNLAIADGQFIVNTEERSIYVDVGTERLRIGDFVSVANIAALPETGAHTTALYYVEDINCLAKWDGSAWVQINRDTGVKEVKVEGTGNAITVASYDATTRILTLTKGETFATPAVVDTKISDKVGEIDGTVKAYVDAKTEGIATDEALQGLTTRIATVEDKVDVEKVSTSIADAKTAILGQTDGADYVGTVKGAYEAAQAAQNTADNKTTMAEVEAKNYATKTEAQGYADAKDTAISAAQAAADKAQGDVDALAGKVGTVPENKTVVQMIADAQTAATYDDTDIKASIKTITDDYLKKADKDTLQSAIDTEKGRMDAFMASADLTENAVDTLKEIQDYINSDGTAAAEMTNKIGALETTVGKAAEGENPATGLVKDVADNKAAIAAERTRAEGVEATLTEADATNLQAAKDYVDQKITGLGIGDYAKKADLDSHTGDTVAHITADERTKWNAAEGKAHEHTNKDLLDTYTQTEENLADAVSKKHSHSFVETELNKIKDGDVANWNAAEQNAKDYADGLADNYDAKGAATTAETNAKSYAESLLTWGEF